MVRKTAEERRAEALAAAREIIATEGIGHATVRTVAERAGMSAGSLRHIFPQHDDLFVALLEDAAPRVAERAQRVLAAGLAAGRPTEEVALDVLLEVVPTRPDTRVEALTQLAVLTAHGGHAGVRRARVAAGDGLDALCRALVGPGEDARELRLVVDGLVLPILERDPAEGKVRALLARVLGRMDVRPIG